MLLDLTDDNYLSNTDDSLKQSSLMDNYKYNTIMSRWLNRNNPVSYVDIIMQNNIPILYNCDMCGVVLNSINTPVDYRYLMTDVVFCTECDNKFGTNIRNIDGVSRELNIVLRENVVFEDLIVHIRNLDESRRIEGL